MCHFQVSSHCCWVPFCHRMLADYGPHIASARPLICHGPPYRLLTLLPGPQCVMGPCTASHCCCLHRHTLPCATFRSPHTAGGFHFVIGCCMASHCCCLHRHTVAPHSGFSPVTAQMSEVCGDSKIDGTHLHVILTDSIISLPQQTPRAFKLKVQCSALI
ncbi:unnamed protein product [Staurois parvus]|uniref:Uncharacterized protein n=2 Tax=Staurois parvus TaxID=386267 RepID=A0ABN9BZH4_9NEOB|nr:unnamed protein product [Staurois parvus]